MSDSIQLNNLENLLKNQNVDTLIKGKTKWIDYVCRKHMYYYQINE